MANRHPTPRVVRQQRLEPLQGLDIQVMGQLIADQPAGDLVAGEVAAGQAGAHPRTLVTGSTFPMLYPVLAPERPPDGKSAPTVVAGQAVDDPGDPGGQADVSDALSGACTGKAPGWQVGPNGRGRASCGSPWDPGGQADVSDALSGACTGKAPGWQAGPNGRGRAS